MTRKVGRPTLYTQELADYICDQISDGRSLRSVCRDDDMPAMSTVFKFLREVPEFSQQYDKATQERAEALAEDCQDLIDETPQIIYDKDGNSRIDAAWVTNQKNRVDVRKWFASKLKPKKFGDKQEIEMSSYIIDTPKFDDEE